MSNAIMQTPGSSVTHRKISIPRGLKPSILSTPGRVLHSSRSATCNSQTKRRACIYLQPDSRITTHPCGGKRTQPQMILMLTCIGTVTTGTSLCGLWYHRTLTYGVCRLHGCFSFPCTQPPWCTQGTVNQRIAVLEGPQEVF